MAVAENGAVSFRRTVVEHSRQPCTTHRILVAMVGKNRNPRFRPFNNATSSALAVGILALIFVVPAVFVSFVPYRDVKQKDRNVVPPKTLWLADLHIEELVSKYPNEWISVVLDNDPHIVVDVNYSSTGDQLLLEAPMQNRRQIQSVLAEYAIDEDQKTDGSKGQPDCVLTVSSPISMKNLKLLVPKVIEACGMKLHDRVDVSITSY